MLERLANALANAGRGADAGDTYQAAADAIAQASPADLQRVVLERRAGEHALRSGHVELGTQRLRNVLERVGLSMPRNRAVASRLSAARRLRLLFRGTKIPAVATDLAPLDLARLDALWAASSGLSMLDYVTADALGIEHLHRALDAGALSHLIRGLGFEAGFEAVIGGRLFSGRVDRLLAQVDDLVRLSTDPYDLAWARMAKGVAAWFRGEWASAATHCAAAADLYREGCRGVAWELAICDSFRLPALVYLGDLQTLAVDVPRSFEGARERGDLFGASSTRIGHVAILALADDRPDAAVEAAATAIEDFPRDSYLFPHYYHLLTLAQAALYRDDPEDAWSRIEGDWASLGTSKILLVSTLRVEIRHLRARAALALAAKTPARAKALRKAAAKEARIMARDRIAPAKPLALLLEAAVAHAEQRKGEATRMLRAALAGLEETDTWLLAASARFQLGRLVGGADGEEHVASATRWMSDRGVRNVLAMADMLVPGFRCERRPGQ